MTKDLQTIVSTIGDLPPMPVVAVKVLELLQNPKSTVDDLAKAIASDQAVSARVLKNANSSFYSLRRQVTTLEHAIVIMGEKTLKSLVLASSLKGINKSFGLMEKMLWEDSLGCAIGARLVSLACKNTEPEEAFLGGLFRHIGKMILNNVNPEGFRLVMEGVYNGEGTEEQLEQLNFPFDHAEIGEAVMQKWNFSPQLTRVIRFHSDIEELRDDEEPGTHQLGATVNLADGFCRYLGIGQREPDPELGLAEIPGAAVLGLPDDRLQVLTEELRNIYEKERDTFLV